MSEKYDQLLNPSVRSISLQAMRNVPDEIEDKNSYMSLFVFHDRGVRGRVAF